MNSLVRFCMYLVVLLTSACQSSPRRTMAADLHLGNDNSGILLILRGLALLYLIYCDIDSLRSFVLVRDYPELLSRVRKVDNLAVSYVGSVKALNTTQATMLAEYEKRVRKYEEYVASSAVYHALTFSSYGFKRRGFGVAVRDGRSRVSRTWRDAVPRLWMMWRLESHWNSLLVRHSADCIRRGV